MLNNSESLFTNDIKRKIRNNFGKNAHTYSKYANIQRKIAEILFEATIKQVQNCSVTQILEIGCGTGLLSKHIISYFKDARHFISDLSSNMIKECKKNISGINTEYLICDGELLPIAKNIKLDLILASMSLHWCQNFQDTIRNLFGMTNRLAFAIPVRDTFQAWCHAHETLGVKSRMMPFYSVSELKEILSKNKPKKLFISIIDLSAPINSGFEFLRYLKLIGATANMDTRNSPYTIAELKNLCYEVDKQRTDGIANYKIAICILSK